MSKITNIVVRGVVSTLVVSVVFISGCATGINVGHDYAYYNTMPSQEARRVLSQQKWIDYSLSPCYVTITDTGISLATYGEIKDYEENGPFLVGNEVYMKRIYYHNGLIPEGTIPYDEIVRIKLQTKWYGIVVGSTDNYVIWLYYKSAHSDGWLGPHIVCSKNPEIYNNILSALLVLCPNVK